MYIKQNTIIGEQYIHTNIQNKYLSQLYVQLWDIGERTIQQQQQWMSEYLHF